MIGRLLSGIFDVFVRPLIPYAVAVICIIALFLMFCTLVDASTKKEKICIVVSTLIGIVIAIAIAIFLMFKFSLILVLIFIGIVLFLID